MHNREKVWRTADGRQISVGDMEESHLVNVINWILDNPDSYSKDTLKLMIAEATYRQSVLFASGKAFPQKVGKRWKLIDPQTGQAHIVPPPADYIEAVKENESYQRMRERTREQRKKEEI